MSPLLVLLLAPALAYNPPVDSAGPLTIRIDGPQEMTRTGVATPVKVVLQNSAADSLRGRLSVTVIDHWTVAPDAPVEFQVDAHGSREYSFTVTAAPGSYNAIYPIHAFALAAHAVLLVKTNFPDAPVAKPPMPWMPAELAPNSEFALWRTPVHRATLQVFGKPARTMPVEWSGADPDTHANVQFGGSFKRGETREGITMHEPYAHGAGTVLVEYLLVLPHTTPIKLKFANAMRDDPPGQTPGDGVTFRVRVLPLDAPRFAGPSIIFAR
jgi:hypothetical protein